MSLAFSISVLILWPVVLFNIILTFALIRRLNKPTEIYSPISVKEGQKAPDFTAETIHGEKASLSSYAGKSVVFLFIGTRCPPCRAAIPSYESVCSNAQRAHVELVLVSGDGKEETRDFVDELNISLPVLVAPRNDNSFFEDYQVTGTPSFCFIDPKGHIAASGYPSTEFTDWKTLVESWEPRAKEVTKLVAAGGR